LLKLKVLIGRHENIKTILGCPAQQLAISQAGPSLLLHGAG